MTKRPIDRKRDSGGTMEIGTPDDQSAITAIFPIGDDLYVVKERGVYEVKLADKIDPNRTNIAIPNTHQKVLNYGSDAPVVGRTLLTAKELFNPNYLPKTLDLTQALHLCFETSKDLTAMLDVAAALERDQLAATGGARYNLQKSQAVALPAVGNIAARCKDFIQKADHSLQSLLSMVRLFYGKDAGREWFEGFTKVVSKRYGESDHFSQFLLGALPFLKFIRNARNCVEHPKESQRIVTRDFFFQSNGAILLPTIEVIHPHSTMHAIPVSQFMGRVQEELVTIVEQTIAFMCSKHVRPPMAAFPVQIVEWPEDSRWEKHVRYSYGFYDVNGRPVRAS
jgi:hypothetical protein